MNKDQIVLQTKSWIQDFIIAHAICPFAALPFNENDIQYVCELQDDNQSIFDAFLTLILALTKKESKHSTAFLILQNELDFDRYLDLYQACEDLLEQAELIEVFQLASFHPLYQYANTVVNEVGNYRNRSPYPMIHILKHSEVEKAIDEFGDTSKITTRNLELLEKLGLDYFLSKK